MTFAFPGGATVALAFLALVDAPASGGAFLVSAGATVAADVVILVSDGRVSGLAGVVGLAFVAEAALRPGTAGGAFGRHGCRTARDPRMCPGVGGPGGRARGERLIRSDHPPTGNRHSPVAFGS